MKNRLRGKGTSIWGDLESQKSSARNESWAEPGTKSWKLRSGNESILSIEEATVMSQRLANEHCLWTKKNRSEGWVRGNRPVPLDLIVCGWRVKSKKTGKWEKSRLWRAFVVQQELDFILKVIGGQWSYWIGVRHGQTWALRKGKGFFTES